MADESYIFAHCVAEAEWVILFKLVYIFKYSVIFGEWSMFKRWNFKLPT